MVDPPDLVAHFPGGSVRVSHYKGDEVTLKAGAWLGLIAAVGIAVGGWNGREERTPSAPAGGES